MKTLSQLVRMPKGGPALSKPPGPPRLVKQPVSRSAGWPGRNLGSYLTPKGGR
jgi:hypothetical protein